MTWESDSDTGTISNTENRATLLSEQWSTNTSTSSEADDNSESKFQRDAGSSKKHISKGLTDANLFERLVFARQTIVLKTRKVSTTLRTRPICIALEKMS